MSNLLTLLLYAALAVVLWRVSRSAVVIALGLGGIGMAAYMSSPRPIEMLHLARAYAEAGPAEGAALLATGEGMLATWTGTAFDVYYVLNFAALLIFGILIYRSTVFSRATAVWVSRPQSSWRCRRTSGRSGSRSPSPRSFRGRSSPSSPPGGSSRCAAGSEDADRFERSPSSSSLLLSSLSSLSLTPPTHAYVTRPRTTPG